MKNPETQSPENMKTENDLIPGTDELNRLKEFLATVACGRSLSPEMREANYERALDDLPPPPLD